MYILQVLMNGEFSHTRTCLECCNACCHVMCARTRRVLREGELSSCRCRQSSDNAVQTCESISSVFYSVLRLPVVRLFVATQTDTIVCFDIIAI